MKDKTRVIHVEPEYYEVIERMADSLGVSRSAICNMLLKSAIARIPEALEKLEEGEGHLVFACEDGAVTVNTWGTEVAPILKEVLDGGFDYFSNEPIRTTVYSRDELVWVAHRAGKRNFEIVKELGVPESTVRRILKRMQVAQA